MTHQQQQNASNASALLGFILILLAAYAAWTGEL